MIEKISFSWGGTASLFLLEFFLQHPNAPPDCLHSGHPFLPAVFFQYLLAFLIVFDGNLIGFWIVGRTAHFFGAQFITSLSITSVYLSLSTLRKSRDKTKLNPLNLTGAIGFKRIPLLRTTLERRRNVVYNSNVPLPFRRWCVCGEAVYLSTDSAASPLFFCQFPVQAVNPFAQHF